AAGAGADDQPRRSARLHRPSDLELRRLPEAHRGPLLGSQRLDPATDGRPDPRPTGRENAPQLGNLLQDFDFSQSPRPPLVLDPNPPPGPPASDPVWRQRPG